MMKILLLSFFTFLFVNVYSQYLSSTVEQVSAPVFLQGSVNNPVIRIKIDVGPNPITVYALFLTTNGSTNATTDIDSAKVFYTGSSNIFTTSVQYGSTVSHPVSGFTIGAGNNFPINSGSNYFWLVYDINDSAFVCDSIDATCYTVYMSNGTATPVVTDPPGFAIIGSCPTGWSEIITQNENSFLAYPNPAGDFISIQKKTDEQIFSVKLLDIAGKCLLSEKINSHENVLLIPVKNIANGIYLISVASDNKTFRQKIIVQH